MNTSEWVRKIAQLSPADQYRIAFLVAENVGYMLAPEPEHPDSPHIQERGWQPIGTAPKHQRVLVSYIVVSSTDEVLGPTVAFAEQDEDGTWAEGDYEIEPTHWQPLPAPPQS